MGGRDSTRRGKVDFLKKKEMNVMISGLLKKVFGMAMPGGNAMGANS